MKQEKSCGCIVLNDQKEILLVHHLKGHWGFPKGHMEEGETEIETALREVKEETNIDVEINEKYRYTQNYCPQEDIQKEVVLFLAQSKNNAKKAQQEEVSEVKWFSFEEALETITYDNTKEVLIKLKEDLEGKTKC